MNPQQRTSAQASTPPGNECQVNPHQVWDQLTPTQQQIVFQSLVLICQHLLQQVSQSLRSEVQDEDE